MANLKILLVVPMLAALLIVFSTCSEKLTETDTLMQEAIATPNAPLTKSGEQEPFVVVEEMPLFPGGDSMLLDFIKKNVVYPPAAKEKNIQGRVIVRFCITETGAVNKITVLKGVDPEIDKEALRVVSLLPAFKPGMQGGKPVPVWYMVPISFSLNGGKLPATAPPPPPPPVTTVIDETKGAEPAPFVMVEEMPQFPGGDSMLLDYLVKNTRYPEFAKTNGIAGKVIVRFCITATGNISMISIMKGVHPEIDAEAVRVVSTLPPFKPGKQGGKPVPVWYMVPVNFALK